METAQWPQQGLEKRVRPHKEKALNCPRCNSTNTKFCYYNNYSLSQPRYFCKSCRRYWTDGGSLRNVPIGGGSRKKNKTYFNSSSSSSSPQPPLTAASSASSWNLQPSKLSSFSLSPSVSALEPIRSGISSRRLISFELPNLSKKTELSANAGMKFPLECGVNGSLVEMEQRGDESELALPFEDLKQVRINGCDELALFWEGVMGNGEGGAW